MSSASLFNTERQDIAQVAINDWPRRAEVQGAEPSFGRLRTQPDGECEGCPLR